MKPDREGIFEWFDENGIKRFAHVCNVGHKTQYLRVYWKGSYYNVNDEVDDLYTLDGKLVEKNHVVPAEWPDRWGNFVGNLDLTTYPDVSPYKCKICEKQESAKYFNNRRMVDEQLCFGCNFWDEYTYRIDESIRINGTHYMLGDGKGGGFGGRKFVIKMNDGKIVETNDLWYQGVIPEYFKSKLPDNATFYELPKPIGHGQGFLA